MSREESIAWLKETVSMITKIENIPIKGKDSLYIDVILPICAANYNLVPGSDAILSINIRNGRFDLIDENIETCLWMWVLVADNIIGTATLYIKKDREVAVLPDSNEVVIECVRQNSGLLIGFLCDLFLFQHPHNCYEISRNEKALEADKGYQSWHNIWEDCFPIYHIERKPNEDFVLPILNDSLVNEPKNNLVESGIYVISDEWFNRYKKEQKQAQKQKKRDRVQDIFQTYLTHPMTLLFGAIGFICEFSIEIPVGLFAIFSYLGAYLGLVIFTLICDLFTREKVPDCPKELKELAYLYSIGYHIPVNPPGKNEADVWIGDSIKFCGFMEELKNFNLSTDDKLCLCAGLISSELASRLNMGKYMDWNECYWQITGEWIHNEKREDDNEDS